MNTAKAKFEFEVEFDPEKNNAKQIAACLMVVVQNNLPKHHLCKGIIIPDKGFDCKITSGPRKIVIAVGDIYGMYKEWYGLISEEQYKMIKDAPEPMLFEVLPKEWKSSPDTIKFLHLIYIEHEICG